MKAHELLTDDSKFCRRHFATTKEDSMNFTNPRINPDTGECKAAKWDIVGALGYCYPNHAEFEKHFHTVEYSKEIADWVNDYKKSLPEKDLNTLNGNYKVNWPIFNDWAKFSVIREFLLKMDI